MKATDLRIALDAARIPSDAATRLIIREAFQALRDYLADQTSSRRGIIGAIEKIGLRLALRLLDDYLASA